MRSRFSALLVGVMAFACLVGHGTTSEAGSTSRICYDALCKGFNALVVTENHPGGLLTRDGLSANPGTHGSATPDSSPALISEPASALLVGLGLFAGAAVVRRRLWTRTVRR